MSKILFWNEMRREQFEKVIEQNPVAIVPLGSIEQHGPHCPVDVDIANAYHIAVHAASLVCDFPLVIAPIIPYGFAPYNEGFPGTISISLETFLSLVYDVCRGIYKNGFKRIILFNGHGGNQHPLRSVAIKLAERNIFVLTFNHWDLMSEELKEWSDTDEGSIGHGGEWETSLQLYLRSHLVDRTKEVADQPDIGLCKEYKNFAFFCERQRETATGVMGDPTVASYEKGERYVNLAAKKLADLARKYHNQDVREYMHFIKNHTHRRD